MNFSSSSCFISSTLIIDVQVAPIINMIPLPTANETEVNAPNWPFTIIGAVSLIYFGQYMQNVPAASPYIILAGKTITTSVGKNV